MDEKTQAVLASMGIGEAEIAESLDRIKNPITRDDRICACGHGASRHDMVSYGGERHECKPTRMYCHCRKFKPVLRAQDTRVFVCRSDGSMALHALQKGIAQSIKKGKSIEWIDEACACARCGRIGTQEVPVKPMLALSGRGILISDIQQSQWDYGDSFEDVLICTECYIDMPKG